MVYSPVHEIEISALSDDIERADLLYLIEKIAFRSEQAGSHARKRAEELARSGFGIADAAHIAYAEKMHLLYRVMIS